MKNIYVREDYPELEISVILKNTSYFGRSSDLQESCKDSTDNSCTPFTKL